MADFPMSFSDDTASYTFRPIAVIRSCFPDRFGIPRQAGLVPSAIAQIEFQNTEENRLSLRGIDAFSHLWVLFVFHQQNYRSWKPLVHPPRLGGNKSVGLYATRSPNRFNPIGMSAVALDRVDMTQDSIVLHIRGGDFLDDTPVLDLKPYIVYADSISTADSAWATKPAALLSVQWSPAAEQALPQIQTTDVDDLKQLIAETIALDPRPGYERGKDGKSGARWYMTIDDINVIWKVEQATAIITQIQRSSSQKRPQKKRG